MTTALVTGATGFIGRHLVDRLLRADTQVIVLCRPESRVPKAWQGRLDVVRCADWSEAGFRSALNERDFAVIFHLAAYGVRYLDRNFVQMFRINVDTPAALVRLGRDRDARMIMAGTFSEYRQPDTHVPLDEGAPLEAEKIYGSSKAAGGLRARALADDLGMKLRILRLFHVYGPGEPPHRLLPSLLAGLLQGRRVSLSAGDQVRDFVYVDDVVEAFVRSDAEMQMPDTPLTAIWNVCTGVENSVKCFASTVARIMGASEELLGFGDIPLRPDDDPWLVGNGELLHQALSWRPTYNLLSGLNAALKKYAVGTPSAENLRATIL